MYEANYTALIAGYHGVPGKELKVTGTGESPLAARSDAESQVRAQMVIERVDHPKVFLWSLTVDAATYATTLVPKIKAQPNPKAKKFLPKLEPRFWWPFSR